MGAARLLLLRRARHAETEQRPLLRAARAKLAHRLRAEDRRVRVGAAAAVTIDDAVSEELAEIDRLPAYLSREETWTFLRVDERTLDRMLERGDLERRRFGGRTLIPRASIRRLILLQATPDETRKGEAAAVVRAIGSGVPKPQPKGST